MRYIKQFKSHYEMTQWLKANSYAVSYIYGIETTRKGSPILWFRANQVMALPKMP